MTDRHVAYVVTLDAATRADDSQHLLDLIARMRGVVSVVPVVQDAHTAAAYQFARHELRKQIGDILWPAQ